MSNYVERRIDHMKEMADQFYGQENTGKVKIHSSHFFDFHDQEFVEEVYRKLLLREPDPTGLQKYVSDVRRGESRYKILSAIARSSEARQAGVVLEGMNAYEISSVVKSIPIIGTLVELFSFFWRIKSFRQDMRALENHLYRISQGIQK